LIYWKLTHPKGQAFLLQKKTVNI